MPKLGSEYCVQIMRDLRERGFTTAALSSDIMAAIARRAATTKEGRRRYIALLKEFGFIVEKEKGLFSLEWDKVEELTMI